MYNKTLFTYLISFAVVFSVSFISSIFTTPNVHTSWYNCIRPSFTPPNIVFPIVWTVLYILLAIALGSTLLLPNSEKKNWLLGLYGFNLIQNIMWSYFYFQLHQVQIAMMILIELIITTFLIIYKSYQVLPSWVGHILIPYMLWLCFAAALNFASLKKTCK